jgi:sortase (surface protein transpeptidase)
MTDRMVPGVGGGRHARCVVAAVLLGVFLVGCGTAAEPPAPVSAPAPTPTATTPSPEPTPEPVSEPEPEPDPVPAGEPVRVVIPAIDVDAELVAIGLDDDGAMDVPDFGLAGWYTEGPPPGHPGPAAIAAHVDSRAGPDVFYRLRELAPGDEVRVTYDSGDEVAFVVRESEQAPKDELPGDRIWPVTSERLLTLITCGGDFDRGVRSYRDNVIVYTEPLGS